MPSGLKLLPDLSDTSVLGEETVSIQLENQVSSAVRFGTRARSGDIIGHVPVARRFGTIANLTPSPSSFLRWLYDRRGTWDRDFPHCVFRSVCFESE